MACLGDGRGGEEEDEVFYCTSRHKSLSSEYNIASSDVDAQEQGITRGCTKLPQLIMKLLIYDVTTM